MSTNETNLFERASRAHLRFDLTPGYLCVEDLWSLTPQSLDSIAGGLRKQLRVYDEALLDTKKVSAKETQLKFDIVKHILDVRVQERELAEEKAEQKQHLLKEKAEQKQHLLTLLARKENADLEIKAMLMQLDQADEIKAMLMKRDQAA